MKSRLEKVYSKLPQKKHNLGKHKFSAKDMNENASAIGEYRDKIVKELSNIFNANSMLKELIDEANENIDYLENDMLDYAVKSEELGIDYENQDDYKFARSEKNSLRDFVEDTEYLYEAIENFG